MLDKTVLITGGTGGIGRQTASVLATMGARVIVTGRSRSRGEDAVAELRASSGNPHVELLLADLSCQAGIRSLAEEFIARHESLDILINNAGLAASSRQLTIDGIESNFAVNVIAPFLLTKCLEGPLTASHAARIVTLTGGDVPQKLELDNLQAERAFAGLASYSQSKLAMMVVMYELAQRMKGTNMTVNVCYPGQASTAMTRSVSPEMFPGAMRLFFPLFKLMVREDGDKSAAKASRSSVYLATALEVEGVTGRYYNSKCRETAWPAAVLDPAVRQQVWSVIEQLTTGAP